MTAFEPGWGPFAQVAVAHLLAVASPGPDLAMVIRQSLSRGRRTATWTSVGIGSAILVHVAYSILGIGLVLRGSPLLFSAVKFSGAAYLAWIGFKSLKMTSWAPGGVSEDSGADRSALTSPVPARQAWTTGFLTNVLNPKVTLFIVALYASLIDPRTPKAIQAAYGVWMSAATMAWFSLVSALFTQQTVRNAFLKAGPWIDRVFGVVLISFAVALALASVR